MSVYVNIEHTAYCGYNNYFTTKSKSNDFSLKHLYTDLVYKHYCDEKCKGCSNVI